jgi:DNA-binding response OmpR family regulator
MGKILVVDDDCEVRRIVDLILGTAAHEVTLAEDGERCLEAYRAAPAQVVIIDMGMPKKAGLETIIELRKEKPRPAIIAMSGNHEMLETVRTTHESDDISCIEKPFKPTALLALVAGELVRRRVECRDAH